jgi:hypothetical protein
VLQPVSAAVPGLDGCCPRPLPPQRRHIGGARAAGHASTAWRRGRVPPAPSHRRCSLMLLRPPASHAVATPAGQRRPSPAPSLRREHRGGTMEVRMRASSTAWPASARRTSSRPIPFPSSLLSGGGGGAREEQGRR